MIVQQKRCWNLNMYWKTLLYFIFNCLPSNFQYKKWTSARVRDSVQESTRFPFFVNFWPQVPATSHFLFIYVKWKFRWNLREVVADQSSAHRFVQPFYQSLVSELKNDIGTKPHVPNRILFKAEGLNQRPVWEKGVCSDSIWTAQQLQIAARISLKTMSGVILNQ